MHLAAAAAGTLQSRVMQNRQVQVAMSENDLLVLATNYRTFFAIAVSSQMWIHELVRDRNEAKKIGPRSDRDIDAMCENDAARSKAWHDCSRVRCHDVGIVYQLTLAPQGDFRSG